MPTHLHVKALRAGQSRGELCAQDRALLVEALAALLRERLHAIELIRDVCGEFTRGPLAHADFGVADILRLARALDQHAKI